MQLLETYLRELYEIRSTGAGVKETSYYPALSKLLNEVGKPLKPRVLCVIHLQDRGAGLPDGGLFTADQFNTKSDAKPREGQLPSRGAIEVKPVGDDAWLTAESAQVTRYWKKYRQVLVTNYRDFVLVAPGPDGKPTKVESFRLAESEKDFWSLAAHPRKIAKAQNERFTEFLKRVLQYKATLASPEDVAWFLASYARDALSRIEGLDIPALASVRSALEEALGLKIEDEKGEHFFRSTLVQTLFYGVFSAWVFWAKKHPPTERKARFDWRLSVYHLSVPVLRTLFHELTDPSRLRELGLAEALDLAGAVLNRVERASFFERFQQEHAVQYFYEPFLKHFDPQLRKDLGVYYTPPEIVTYMIERVDRVLRDELNLSDGLADPNVFILDPCCGTGSFLVEAVRRIHRTIEERGADALTAAELKQAVLSRIFGFEILPAPFVVAHLQMGLLLQSLGAPLSEKKTRARERLSDQCAYRMGSAQRTQENAHLSGVRQGTCRVRSSQARHRHPGYSWQPALRRF